MSRRTRALGFAVAAALCAGLAATAAGGYRAELAAQLGELRPAVVAARPLARGEVLRPARLDRLLEVRRVPERFLPAATLASPAQAAGRVPSAPIPAGAYVLAPQLRLPGQRRSPPASELGRGVHPVQIAVSAAASLAESARSPARVDVVVTTQPQAGGPGRTYVAAEDVVLLELRSGGGTDDGLTAADPGWTATLALTRRQALRLIQAESYARSVRLIPR